MRTWTLAAALGISGVTGAPAAQAHEEAKISARTYAQTIAPQQAGSPILELRHVAINDADPTWFDQALGDALAEWTVTPVGTIYRVRPAKGGGFPQVSRTTAGAGAVANLRSLVHEAGFDEPRSVDPRPPSSGDSVEVAYQHASGRYVSGVVKASDPGLARLIAALEHPVELGATRPAASYTPSVLRIYGREGLPPNGQVVGRWPLRATALSDATLRCIAVRGVETTRLRTEVTRLAKLKAGNVSSEPSGITLAWLRSGRRTVQLAVRPVLPGEPDCPTLAR